MSRALEWVLFVGFLLALLVPFGVYNRHLQRKQVAARRGFEADFGAFASSLGLTRTGPLSGNRLIGDLEVTLSAFAAWGERPVGAQHGYVPEGAHGVLAQLARPTRAKSYAITHLTLTVRGRRTWRWPAVATVSFAALRPSRHQLFGGSDIAPTPIHPPNAQHDQLREAFAWFAVTKAGVARPPRFNGAAPSLLTSFGRLSTTDYARLARLEVDPELSQALVHTAASVVVTSGQIWVSRGVEGLDSNAYRDLMLVGQLVARHIERWSVALEAAQRGSWREG